MKRAIVSRVIAVALAFAAAPAGAVVYCKAAGVPKGCVARPVTPAAGVVATPALRGGVGGPASGVGMRPGAGAGAAGTAGYGIANRNGGVNRAGRR
jgi:hypothetical protein